MGLVEALKHGLALVEGSEDAWRQEVAVESRDRDAVQRRGSSLGFLHGGCEVREVVKNVHVVHHEHSQEGANSASGTAANLAFRRLSCVTACILAFSLHQIGRNVPKRIRRVRTQSVLNGGCQGSINCMLIQVLLNLHLLLETRGRFRPRSVHTFWMRRSSSAGVLLRQLLITADAFVVLSLRHRMAIPDGWKRACSIHHGLRERRARKASSRESGE
mmetsp:Transcript_50455/g.109369  ORF Transcript_50455/g.109369 Transcript_50455/m.109369 type:complete len:217 (-) Transcript_50455:119-769(-)